jgi:hypothetical protein
MTLKKEHLGGILLVGGGIAIFYYLATRQAAGVNANEQPEQVGNQVAPQQAQFSSYPNAGVNPASNVSIGGSPINLTYNYPVSRTPAPIDNSQSTAVADGVVFPETTDGANALQAVAKISASQIQLQAENLQSVFSYQPQPGGGRAGVV